MVNGKNQYDATKYKEFNDKLNMYANELLDKIRMPKSRNLHVNTYSCLYEILKNSSMRGEIESCHSLVRKVQYGDYSSMQKQNAADRLKDKISYIASESLLKVKASRRLESMTFAKMIKQIILDDNLFNQYIEYSDLSIKNYYEAQQTALRDNPKSSITYETLSKPSGKTKNIF